MASDNRFGRMYICTRAKINQNIQFCNVLAFFFETDVFCGRFPVFPMAERLRKTTSKLLKLPDYLLDFFQFLVEHLLCFGFG